MEIFAHRGASGEYPENTLLAFEQAINQGCDGIELDLQLIDNQLIVFHDRFVDRCTDGKGRVDSFSFSQLRKLNAGRGEKIPTLNEVLELIAGRCRLNLEIKHYAAAEPTLNCISQQLAGFDFSQEQLIISSFDLRIPAAFAPGFPQFEFAALTTSIPNSLASFARPIHCNAIHADIDSFDPAFLQDSHKRGMAFRLYTVDDPGELKTLVQLGADGVFTNYPARAKKLLSSDQSR